MQRAFLLVNFGGPRELSEIPEFLTALLTDRDVIRTKLPALLHTLLFRRIAKKRAKKIAHDYALIGGKSPIFEDTEAVAKEVGEILKERVLTFHRYLPATHKAFIQQIETIPAKEILIFPMFPQFTYATTGSIARWLGDHLSGETLRKLRWIKSYADHPSYIASQKEVLQNFLDLHHLSAEDTYLFFSAHGVPKDFIFTGDIYQSECERSFRAVTAHFPAFKTLLAYQSKFGRGEWIRPYTDETCQDVLSWYEGKKNIVFVPITFTSDHIETLFEIETLYLPIIREKGLNAYRCPALNREKHWIEAITKIMESADLLGNDMLIRHTRKLK